VRRVLQPGTTAPLETHPVFIEKKAKAGKGKKKH
jgi:hypothetical protein